jgi:hypothetical protein
MNVELLRRIQTQIREHPETFRMDDWNCGTAMCIAGHAVSLSGFKWAKSGKRLVPQEGSVFWSAHGLGRKLLGLDDNDQAADRLFYTPNWPEQFFLAFCDSLSSYPESARIACERIDHFIETDGAE